MPRPVTVLHSLFVGIVAAAAVWLSLRAGLPVWAVFLGCALYFVFCSAGQSALLAGAQIIAGLILGAGLIVLNGILATTYGDYSLMILAFLFGSSLVFVEGLPPLNNIPAYYFGVIAMFASGPPAQPGIVMALALSIVLGLALGWITVYGRTRLSELLVTEGVA